MRSVCVRKYGIWLLLAVCIAAADSVFGQSSVLDAPVSYSSKDSMVMMGNGNAYLHGSGTIKYQSMELESEYIQCDLDNSTIYSSCFV